MKFDVDDKNRCRPVCVKFHLNWCRFAVAVAKCLGGSLFWGHSVILQDVARNYPAENDHVVNFYISLKNTTDCDISAIVRLISTKFKMM